VIFSRNEDCRDRKILLFDLSYTGHHAEYILHLVKYWSEFKTKGSLNILVSPKFLEMHLAAFDTTIENTHGDINFISISHDEEAKLKAKNSALGRALYAFNERKLLFKYVNLLKPTHCLLMYLDSVLLSMALMKGLPCLFSGIYFRPIFHYNQFTNFNPSLRERVWQVRDKFLLFNILKKSNFQFVFCLDPFVVETINKSQREVKALHLPDPVQVLSNAKSQLEEMRNKLGINSNRKIFLMFGVFEKRKGIFQLLKAIELLPLNLCQNLCLLLVGSIGSESQVITWTYKLSRFLEVQVVNLDQFVSNQDVQLFFEMADVVLAPYQHHVGMSGILVRAAAAQKPVLSSDFGLMGEIVRRYSLGLAIDTTKPTEIAKGLRQFLNDSPEIFCDYSKMKNFADQNTSCKFAKVIFENL